MHLDHPPPCPPSCDHCLAFDNITRAICSRTPSPRSKWCSVHEELQAKLLKTYKRYSLAVESYDDSVLPISLESILSEEDLVQLRQWSEKCRQKWSLVRRVIVARAEHHQQFYAGGDWGHCLFVETLKDESVKLERFLRALDRQAYSLNLAKSSASWILAAPKGPKFVCDDVPTPNTATLDSTADNKTSSHGLLTPPPTPPLAERQLPSSSPSSSTMNKNQRKAARRKAARTQVQQSSPSSSPSGISTSLGDDDEAFFASLSSTLTHNSSSAPELLAHLRHCLDFPSDLPSSVRPETWKKVVSGIFRHVILRVPSLANLALQKGGEQEMEVEAASCGSEKLDSIESFLDLLERRIPCQGGGSEVEKLWKGLKFARSSAEEEEEKDEVSNGLIGVGVIAEAISNLFRPTTIISSTESAQDQQEEEEAIAVLGGKVWKDSCEGQWSREAWDLFYAFVACSGCALIATRSLQTWSTNRRLAALGHYPAWSSSSASNEGVSGTADKIFRLSGIVLCSSNSSQSGRKVKRVESKEKVPKGKKTKKVIYIEEMERSWMYIRLPINEPRSRMLLDALASLPHRFSVLARETSTETITHKPIEGSDSRCSSRSCTCCNSDVWLNKVRSGLSPAERKSARWSSTSYFPLDTVLSSLLRTSSPETRFQEAAYKDSYDCLILDSSSYDNSPTYDNWSVFAESVAQAIIFAQGFETPSELTRSERKGAIERGEMSEGEWAKMCEGAKEEEVGGKGRGKGGKQQKKVVYVCEEELTARNMFRESC